MALETDFNVTPYYDDYDESKDPLACKIEGSLLSGPQTQVVSQTQSIAEVKYEFSTNCPQLINSSVSNLPPGITMSFSDNIATISGAPTSQASGVYNYVISLDNALSATATDPAAPASAEFSIEGTIEVTSSVTKPSCSQASITLVSGNPSQSLTLGDTMGDVTWQLSTDCPPDGNGVPLNSSASGLPTGVIYSFSGQNQQITLSGIPTAVGTYTYNIVYYNAQQLSNSSVVASVTGILGISSVASSTNSTQTWSIDVSAPDSNDYQLSGNDRNGSVSGLDPTVTIALGDTLNFNVNSPGHPFYLKTQSTTGTGNQVSGASNQGTENGTVTWTPTATGTYYYICSLHGGMSGTIIVQ